MKVIPALSIVVVPFRASFTNLTAPPDDSGGTSWQEELEKQVEANKPAHVSEDDYLEMMSFPAGATIYLGHPVNSVISEHSIYLNEQDKVTAWRFPLFVFEDNRYFLLYNDAVSGMVEHAGGDRQDLRCLRHRSARIETKEFGAVFALDLADKAEGILLIGDRTLLFSTEHPYAHLHFERMLDGDVIPPCSREWLENKRIDEARAVEAAKQAAETEPEDPVADQGSDPVQSEAASLADAPPAPSEPS